MTTFAATAFAPVTSSNSLKTVSTAKAHSSTVSALVDTKYVKSGEALLQVRIQGEGQPIVCVPGFVRGASDYEEVMAGLAARGYRAIAINARGCEGSPGHGRTPPSTKLPTICTQP
jgi:pimeloyl-ACP methyl ester carboxylesterase